MRAIHISIIFLIIIINGCSTVEIAKEVTKATKSITTTIEKMTISQNDEKKTDDLKSEKVDKKKDDDLKKEKEEIIIEKKKLEAVVKKQKEITTIKILNKTLDQLMQDFGKPSLIRQDANTKAVRFDTSSCRLFVYFNSMIKKSRVEYYEIRNEKGELLNQKEKINICIQEVRKT